MDADPESSVMRGDTDVKHGSSSPLSQAPQSKPPDTLSNHLRGGKLLVALTGVLLSVFLTGLDQTVVANALPIIAGVFNALANLTWVPTAFLITQVACLPLFGQLPIAFPIQWIFFFAVLIFEIGSLLSALSPDFGFLIFARAFQGVGAGGIFVSSLVVIADIAPLKDRPRYMGALGAVFALGTIIGPLVGGGLVDKVSWRWCFYINLPLSVPTFLASIIFIRIYTSHSASSPSADAAAPTGQGRHAFTSKAVGFFSKIQRLDIIGFILVLGFTTCLVLGLQWGGNTKPWKSADVIATLVLSGVLLVIFIAWQRYKASKALVPLILLRSRTIIGCCFVGLWSRMGFFAALYYLPLYFQAVHNHSAVRSGVDLLPLSIALILSAGISGGIISRLGNYWYVMFFGPWIAVVAFGLFFTLDEHTSAGKYIGYQILAGVGIGTTTQVVVIAAQADVGPEHVSQASALVTFVQWLGGIIGLAVAGTIFQNKLASGLRMFAPGAPLDVLRQSVSTLSSLSGSEHAGAVHAYVKALQFVFIGVALPSSSLCSISTLLVKNRSLKTAGEKATDNVDTKQQDTAEKK